MRVVAHPGPVLALPDLLAHHQEVQIAEAQAETALKFEQGDWKRVVRVGGYDPEVLGGLIETMDNNPLVCADAAVVPGPAATLALIALAPLIRACIIQERPGAIFSFDTDEVVEDWVIASEYREGVDVFVDPQDLGSVRAATVMAMVSVSSTLSDLDDLFDEAYARSFFVRRVEDGQWDTSLVAGKPWAAYRLRVSTDNDRTLLTVQVMADKDGKCGAAQVVHMMNVMAGFEESLGIAG